MSKVNLKDNIWIEGFDDVKSQLFKFNYLMNDIDKDSIDIKVKITIEEIKDMQSELKIEIEKAIKP